jgi:microcystin degradation protein MlrC
MADPEARMTHRVLIAGISLEAHSFVPYKTQLSDFRTLRGEAMWRALGDRSTLAGGLEIAKERGWEVIPIIDMVAGAGGNATDESVEYFWRIFDEAARRALSAGPVDGVWLNVHGAMVSESLPDVEGELLRRMRLIPGLERCPIGGVLDLHGTFTPLMAEHSTCFVAYKKNPHTDGKEAAMDGARLLDRLMRNRNSEQAVVVFEHPPLILHPSATGTADEPMRTFEAMARDVEQRHPEILVCNVFGGFAYSDLREVGVGFFATTIGDPEIARAELRALSATAMRMKHYADPVGVTLEDALARLPAHAGTPGPVVLVEPADNIGGGAPGDLTLVLEGLIAHDVQNAGVIINDPECVQILQSHAPGAQVTLDIGGKSGAIGSKTLRLNVTLRSLSDGRFRIEDPHSHLAVNGLDVSMGPCAVVTHGGVTILLTSKATAPFDLAQWRSQRIQPESLAVIGVKAAVAHRQAYEPIQQASYTLNTAGPCAPDLRALPYTRVMRPVYPLDSSA